MNEKKKMIFILILLTVFLLLIGFIYLMSYKEAKAEMYKFYTAYNSDEKNLIFIGRKTCYYCQLQKPILDDFDYQYHFGYTYIDTDKISTKQLTEILNTLNVDVSSFGTPYTAVVKNKKKINEFSGAGPEKEYFDFLKKNEIIKTDKENLISYINYDEYSKLLNEKKPGTIIVIGDSSDEQYKTMMKYLRNVKAEYNVPINYFSTQEVSQETAAEFSNIKIPTMIAINKNGEQKTLTGNKTYDEYISFLKNSDIIK